jgi:hypothetical protein
MSGAQQRRYYRARRRYWIISGITKRGKKIQGLKTHSWRHASQLRADLLRGTVTVYGNVELVFGLNPTIKIDR